MYRFYCRMRPPAPGAIPPGAVSVTEHLSRCYAPEIDRMVWGCVTYDRELTTCEIAEYDLIREPREGDNVYGNADGIAE